MLGMAEIGDELEFTLAGEQFAQLFGVLSGERPKPLAIAGAVLVTGGAVLLSR